MLTLKQQDKQDKNDSSGNASVAQQEQQQASVIEKPVVAHSGQLMFDATVAEQQIEYPTVLKLLNESRQQLERMIKQVCHEGNLTIPRTYKKESPPQVPSDCKKEIKKGLRQQLQYIKRDLRYMDDILEKYTILKYVPDKWDLKLIRAIHVCNNKAIYGHTNLTFALQSDNFADYPILIYKK